jgi:hypothetical protein
MGLATMFTATAAASPSGGPMGPGSMIELDDLTSIEDLVLYVGTQVSTDGYCDTPVNELDIEITNNNAGNKFYDAYLFNGTVEGGESPEFIFPEDFTAADFNEMLTSGSSHSYPTYGTSASVVRVIITSSEFMGEPTVVFEEDITLCEEDANAQLAEAAAEYAAEVAAEEAAQALIEAQEAAEAAEQALAEAQEAAEAAEAASAEDATEAAAAAAAAAEEAAQAVIAQAQAETEAAETALAQAVAEKELALAQVETEKAKADAILAQSQANEETLENTPEDTSSETSETSDQELAVGEDLGEHSKSGMSGVVLGLIIVLGLVGVGAVTGAVLNLRKQR